VPRGLVAVRYRIYNLKETQLDNTWWPRDLDPWPFYP